MKYLCIIAVLAISATLSPTLAASNGGGTSSGAGSGAQSSPVPALASEKVKPGEKHSNNDTEVANQNTSGSKCITVTPANGNADTATNVRVDGNVTCTITGIDANDHVSLGNTVIADVTCTGGTINMSGSGSTLTLHVTSGPTSVSARVNLPGGGTVWVAPGSNVVIAP
ncbi:MAG: hypothetical protein ACI8QZ_003806 [Chlamydiales bacterium]|jgi:hypothetical protein